VFPWSEFDNVLFEHGLSLSRQSDGLWVNESATSPLVIDSPTVACQRFGLRPIVVSGPIGNVRVSLVLPTNHGRILDIYRSELAQALPRSLGFVMGAMLYHCKALARLYSDICRDHLAFTKIPNAPSGEKVVTRPEAPFFEFEALLAAVARGYEYLIIPLWKHYGCSGDPPRNFTQAVQRGTSFPTLVGDRLRHTHDQFYVRAKDYRDCIQHNVDMGSSSWAMFEQLEGLVWSVIVRVPDNPEMKSRSRFRFENNLDALTVSWGYVAEFFGLCDVLFGAGLLSQSRQKSS
jgi:hypothetical protein